MLARLTVPPKHPEQSSSRSAAPSRYNERALLSMLECGVEGGVFGVFDLQGRMERVGSADHGLAWSGGPTPRQAPERTTCCDAALWVNRMSVETGPPFFLSCRGPRLAALPFLCLQSSSSTPSQETETQASSTPRRNRRKTIRFRFMRFRNISIKTDSLRNRIEL
ncbi:unnamed protein product [Boreogadus saida]